MSLPRELAQWAHELSDLPTWMVDALRPMVLRLHVAVGSSPAANEGSEGEVDGLEGIGTRGSWDRMLLTEWALASEVPDEFLRRAAERELGFLQVRRVMPQSGRRCVVFVDGSPSQHGAPRLMHLAALVVLSRRARESGSTFYWSDLANDRPLMAAVNDDTLAGLRKGGAWQPASPQQLERALARGVDDTPFDDDDEVWLVGGQEVLRFEGSYRRIVVDEPIATPHRLDVEVFGPAAARPTPFRLEVPPDAVVKRVLRRPRVHDDATNTVERGVHAHRLEGEGGLWWEDKGHRLVAPFAGGIASIPAPNSVAMAEGSKPGKIQRWRVEGLVAAGCTSRRLFGLRPKDGMLTMVRSTGGPADAYREPKGYEAPQAVGPLRRMANGTRVHQDHDGTLYIFDQTEPWLHEVVAWDVHGAWVARAKGVFSRYQCRKGAVGYDNVGDVTATHLHAGFGSFALIQRGRSWGIATVNGRFASVDAPVPADDALTALVYGPWNAANQMNQTAAWVEQDHRTVRVLLPEQVTRSFVADTDIIALAAHPSRPHLAWRTRDGRVDLVDVVSGTRMLRVGA